MLNLSNDQIRFHYVQKAYLKNFSRADREGEVFELDKELLSSKSRGVNEIAWEKFFYFNSMENRFNKEFESKTPKVFKKIIDNGMEDLKETDYELLAKFVNYHILRVKNVRLQIKAELELSGRHYTENDMKNLHDSHIQFHSEDYKQLMKLQLILLIKGEKGAKFVTSDVPVVIHNYKTPKDPTSYSCYSNGSIIMLPIDPNKTIIYINDNKKVKQEDLRNVLHPNYYQTIESYKYIYSSDDDFKIIKSYIKNQNLQPWTLDDRKAGIKRVYNSLPIIPEFGRDLWQEFGYRTWYSFMEGVSEYIRNILDNVPKREPYTCCRCGKTSNICIQRSHPEKPDRCIECGEPIIE